jgi:hypothetical protein
MTPADVSMDAMGDLMLDEVTVDLLLEGRLAPEDAPPGYADVAGLVRALALPPTAAELALQVVAVEAALTELSLRPAPHGSKAPAAASGRKWSARSRFLKTKVASLVLVGTLVGTTGLAVAGALPAPLQDAASKVLAKVGISVPTSDGHPASSGEDISTTATTTDATGVDKGAEISTAASGGHSHAGQRGPGSLPPTARKGTHGPPDETPGDEHTQSADEHTQGNASPDGAGDGSTSSGKGESTQPHGSGNGT